MAAATALGTSDAFIVPLPRAADQSGAPPRIATSSLAIVPAPRSTLRLSALSDDRISTCPTRGAEGCRQRQRQNLRFSKPLTPEHSQNLIMPNTRLESVVQGTSAQLDQPRVGGLENRSGAQ